MSEETIKKIIQMNETTAHNRALVERRMHESGIKVEPYMVDSIAKYWETLEKLAAE